MGSFGGDWTADKLDRVRKYLQAYRIALSKQRFQLLYIDAFAGTGYCQLKRDDDSGEYLFPELADDEAQSCTAGSAKLALEIEPPFSEYVFIELDPKKSTELEKLKAQHPGRNIRVVNEEANAYIQRLCAGDWAGRRAVMFLDPYGMQVDWDTIKAIAATRSIDLLYLFPVGMGANRLLKRDGKIDDALRHRLDRLFGETEWYDEFYRTRTAQTLFEDELEITEKTATFDSISDYIVRRLKSEFAGVVEKPLTLVNSKNTPLYLLCFASGNLNGHKIAVRIAQGILKKR